LEGQADAALVGYRDALRRWGDLSLVWDQALCTIDMATLLDPAKPEVATAIESGREILMRLAARGSRLAARPRGATELPA
jgi:hypothetical protein